jgi:hypothetical protein
MARAFQEGFMFKEALGFGFALVIGVSLAMGQQLTKDLLINRAGKLGEQMLLKGSYSVRFDPQKEGEAVFLKGNREIAKVAYKITKLAKPAPEGAVVFAALPDGSYRIKRIEFKGMDTAIVFE